uniref:Enoyl reductase (ER) domain-containing protein n=1 Tax=Araucaria cunninghamii TaxID=56994 RepID=A0A0D6QXQ6_ARACU
MGNAENAIENGGDADENIAAWLCGVQTIQMKHLQLPSMGARDVKVRIKAVGICGSDVHYVKYLRLADFIIKEPYVLGHECAGIVEQVGSEVKHLVVGDRVSLEPAIPCRVCKHCVDGYYNLCQHVKAFGTPPLQGSLAHKMVHPADLCFKLPDNVSMEEGAMCEPLSVGLHACRRACVGAETTVLIIGSGTIGLITMLSARAFGAPRIVIADVNEERLTMAKKLGADDYMLVSTHTQDIEGEVIRIQKAMGKDIDITFDCAGFSKTMTTALKATRAGGKVCLIGMGHHEMTVPLPPAACREVDVIGIFRYRNTWPLCMDFLSTGKLDVKPLITHRFGFSQEQVEEAFETSARGGNAIKVMFMI